ncbi:MAG TPA: hypothetical protein VHK22_08075 [Gaiellaceae bacterium]|jgi:hypothetical protein|nr:hypothetical protein [Gaiellaceae bacterium]
MSSAEKFVTAAYLVVLAVVLAWIAIHAAKLQRLDREVRELEEREAAAETDDEPEAVEAGRR